MLSAFCEASNTVESDAVRPGLVAGLFLLQFAGDSRLRGIARGAFLVVVVKHQSSLRSFKAR
jgi:hypothetical protein